MKKIAALTSIPDNEKFKFTNRASTMMSKVSRLQLFGLVVCSADKSTPPFSDHQWQTQVEQTQA